MAAWWTGLFLVVTVTANHWGLDSWETFYDDSNEVDNEVINTRTATQPLPSIYPAGAPRSCRSWCSCSGQTRSSYCCPTGIPNDSMCRYRSTFHHYGESSSVIAQPGVADGGRVVCSGSYCDTRGPIFVGPPGMCARRVHARQFMGLIGYICASRICRVLVNSAATTTWGVNQPLGNTCTSHADCGENVCCSLTCMSMEACIANRRSRGTRLPYDHNSHCTSDVDCNSIGSNYICCDSQCKTRASCSPRQFP